MPDCLSHYQYTDLRRAALEGVSFDEAIKPLVKVGFAPKYLKESFGEFFPEFAKKDEKPTKKPDPLT